MAIVYPQATLTPSKRELMDAWLPTRPWFDGNADRKPVGSFRFDDPAGEVGLEGFLLGGEGLPTLLPAADLPRRRARGRRGAPGRHHRALRARPALGLRRLRRPGLRRRARPGRSSPAATGVDHEYDVGDGPESRPTNAQVQGSGSAAPTYPSIDEVGCHDEGPLTIVERRPARAGGRPDRRHLRRRRRDARGAPGRAAPTS